MFLIGTFTGAAERWAIIEKEAFALVETVKRADYCICSTGQGFSFIYGPQEPETHFQS
jgi:hypothetical protein